MSVSGQSGMGKICWKFDAGGAEVPVATNVAYGTTAGGCGYSLGEFKVLGDLAETDTGMVSVDKANGFLRISGNDEDGKGAALGTAVCLSPALNGAIVVEARVEMVAITARSIFIGLAGTVADDVAEPITSTTLTLTKVVPCIGFVFDSQLTTSGTASTAVWHMPYMLAGTTSQTDTDIAASQVAVAAECDILRLIVNSDGSAEWWINGKLEQTVKPGLGATTTTLLGGLCGCWGTTSTAANLDIDYFVVEANRDWTR